MSRRPPHQSTPYGSKHLPEPSGMNSASNNLRQSAPADEQQELLPHEHEWLSPEEIDALGARRNRPTIPTNEDWRSYSGKKAVRYQRTDFSLANVLLAGGLTSSTPLPASPYANQDQSRQSEMQRYGSYGDPPYGGFPSTAPPANLSSYQDQNRQDDISGETGLENDDKRKDLPRSIAHRLLKPLLV